MSEIHINDIMSFICIYMYICIYLYSRCSITGNCYIESVNSLSWEAGGPQAAGGNKTANGRFFFFFFSRLILCCHGDTYFHLNFISNLELTNAFSSWKCLS